MRQLVGIIVIILLILGVWALVNYAGDRSVERYADTAKNWVETSSPTYLFDGSDLELTEGVKIGPDVYQYTFKFNSSQAGYGDRTDQVLAQVITPHTIVLRIEDGKVVSAITDGVYDELTGELAGEPDGEEGEKDEEDDNDRTVELFFYDEEADKDDTGNVMCSADAVVPVTRVIEDYTIEKHIQTLLDGPNAEEKEQGLSSEYPLEGLELKGVSLSDEGVLTIQLEDSEGATVGGSCRVGILANQLVKTAESIPGVKEVVVDPEDLFQP